MIDTLFIRLEGPMMSFSVDGLGYRRTSSEPTKSAVMGLLGCCLGTRDISTLWNDLVIGVRVDQKGTLVADFKTVQGNHLNANNSIKKDHTEIVERTFLVNARFMIAVQRRDNGDVGYLADALSTPVWTPYLGMNSCPPSAPIYAGHEKYPSLEVALREFQPCISRALIEDDSGPLRGKDNLIGDRPRYLRDVNYVPA